MVYFQSTSRILIQTADIQCFLWV